MSGEGASLLCTQHLTHQEQGVSQPIGWRQSTNQAGGNSGWVKGWGGSSQPPPGCSFTAPYSIAASTGRSTAIKKGSVHQLSCNSANSGADSGSGMQTGEEHRRRGRLAAQGLSTVACGRGCTQAHTHAHTWSHTAARHVHDARVRLSVCTMHASRHTAHTRRLRNLARRRRG